MPFFHPPPQSSSLRAEHVLLVPDANGFLVQRSAEQPSSALMSSVVSMRASRSACVALSNGTRDVADQGKDQPLSLLCGHARPPLGGLLGGLLERAGLGRVDRKTRVGAGDPDLVVKAVRELPLTLPIGQSCIADTAEIRDGFAPPKSGNNPVYRMCLRSRCALHVATISQIF
jgi:hypothetical protein